MAKVRVYELAKELGVDSKTIMTKLNEFGEFVRSASSTIEPPVVRKLRDTYPVGGGGSAARSSTRPEGTGTSGARPGGRAPRTRCPVEAPRPAAAAPAAPAAPARAGAPAPARPAPARPAPAAAQAPHRRSRPLPPAAVRAVPVRVRRPPAARPGNNPFAPSQGMPRRASVRRGGRVRRPASGQQPVRARPGHAASGRPRPSSRAAEGAPAPRPASVPAARVPAVPVPAARAPTRA